MASHPNMKQTSGSCARQVDRLAHIRRKKNLVVDMRTATLCRQFSIKSTTASRHSGTTSVLSAAWLLSVTWGVPSFFLLEAQWRRRLGRLD